MVGQDGKRVMASLQMGVRPIQLYEFTFPKAQTEQALRLIAPGSSWTSKYQKYFNFIRKLLGLKEIPPYTKMQGIPHQQFVEVIGIGYHEDKDRGSVELL